VRVLDDRQDEGGRGRNGDEDRVHGETAHCHRL
jgi:hypothetical protein